MVPWLHIEELVEILESLCYEEASLDIILSRRIHYYSHCFPHDNAARGISIAASFMPL